MTNLKQYVDHMHEMAYEASRQSQNLADEVDSLIEENSDLMHENKRLKRHIENLKKIKMGDHTDEILKNCEVPAMLKRKATAENSD